MESKLSIPEYLVRTLTFDTIASTLLATGLLLSSIWFEVFGGFIVILWCLFYIWTVVSSHYQIKSAGRAVATAGEDADALVELIGFDPRGVETIYDTLLVNQDSQNVFRWWPWWAILLQILVAAATISLLVVTGSWLIAAAYGVIRVADIHITITCKRLVK